MDLRNSVRKPSSKRKIPMSSISKDKFLSCIGSKGTGNIQPVAKSVVNYLVNMIDRHHYDIVPISKIQNEK